MTISLTLALLAQAAPPVAAPPPLQPSSQWLVEFEDNLCAASRLYGTGAAVVAFRIHPRTLDGQVEISLIETASGRGGPIKGRGRISFAPSGTALDADYSVYDRASGKRVTTARFARTPLMEALAAAQTVTLTFGKRAPVSIAATLSPALAAQIERCDADLVETLGVDRASIASIATPAEPIGAEGSWITQNDYPAAAVFGGNAGTTLIVWKIGVTGQVSDCRIVQSGGSALLDEAACGAIMRRARYTPARDAHGQPVESFAVRKVVWGLTGR